MSRGAGLLPLRVALRRWTPWAVAFLVGAAGAAMRPPGAADDTARAEMILAGAAVALVAASGTGSRDQRTGSDMLWMQKPGAPWVRVLAAWTRAMVLATGLTGAAALVYWALDPVVDLRSAGTAAVVGTFFGLSAGAVVFGFSGLGVRLDVLPALAVIVYLGLLGAEAAAPFATPMSALLEVVRFPFAELGQVDDGLQGGPAPTPGTWFRIGGHAAGWLALGLAGRAGRTRLGS